MSTIIKRGLVALPLVLIGWIAVMAVVMRVSDAAPGAVVPFPSASVMRSLPSDTAILGMNRVALTVSNRPGMAKELYAAGAWLVLPAGLTGCLPLTEEQRRRME